eukprot:1159124-Pelagomonas_calceolata.AAC.4
MRMPCCLAATSSLTTPLPRSGPSWNSASSRCVLWSYAGNPKVVGGESRNRAWLGGSPFIGHKQASFSRIANPTVLKLGMRLEIHHSKPPTPAPKPSSMSDSSSDSRASSLSDRGCSSADVQEPAERKKQASESAAVASKAAEFRSASVLVVVSA